MRGVYKCSNESGRSMVEMLGVLAIVGVLSVGGIAGYSKAMAKYKTNKTMDQISMIITNIRTTFGNQASYYGLDNKTSVTYDIVGNDVSNGTSGDTVKLRNPYGGNVTISDECDETDTTFCPEFTVKYEKIDATACATIISSDWGGSAASGLVSITVGEKEYTWTGENKFPINYTTAFTDCGSGTGTKDITWKYN